MTNSDSREYRKIDSAQFSNIGRQVSLHFDGDVFPDAEATIVETDPEDPKKVIFLTTEGKRIHENDVRDWTPHLTDEERENLAT